MELQNNSGALSATNSKGKTYYLHKKNQFFYFAKEKNHSRLAKQSDLKPGLTVKESSNGLLYLKHE